MSKTLRQNRALSLAEVVIGAALMMVLALLLTNMYGMSLASLRLGNERVEAEKQCRVLFERLRPMLAGAVAPNPAADAIYTPTPGDSSPEVVFCSSGLMLLKEASLEPTLYRVRRRGDTAVVEELYRPDRREVLGTGIDSLNFERTGLNSVLVTSASTTGSHTYTVRSLISVPYYTAR